MKIPAIGLLLIALPSLCAAQTGTRNWVQHPLTDHWIGVTDATNLGWQGSEDLAVSLGGNLLTIRNEPENIWAELHTENVPMWMGINDIAVEGTWEWSSGEPVTWTNWYPNQPDGDDLGVMNPDFTNSPGTWFAASSANYRGLLELEELPWTDWLPPYHLFNPGYYGTTGDLDGDGAPEILIPDDAANLLRVWNNDGEGWFTAGQVVGGSVSTREVQCSDMDGDGDLDVVETDGYINRGVRVLFNDGAGNLAALKEKRCNSLQGRGRGELCAHRGRKDESPHLNRPSSPKAGLPRPKPPA